MSSRSPINHLISVDKDSARAAILMAQVIDKLRDDYHLIHVANASGVGFRSIPLRTFILTVNASSNRDIGDGDLVSGTGADSDGQQNPTATGFHLLSRGRS